MLLQVLSALKIDILCTEFSARPIFGGNRDLAQSYHFLSFILTLEYQDKKRILSVLQQRDFLDDKVLEKFVRQGLILNEPMNLLDVVTGILIEDETPGDFNSEVMVGKNDFNVDYLSAKTRTAPIIVEEVT